MGDRSRSTGSSGLRFLVRLLALVVAVLVLCVSERAQAAPVTGSVPMCGERNESIAAPPIFRVFDDGAINALPCQLATELGVGQSAPPAPDRVIVHERPERVLGSAALCVTRTESTRLPVEGDREAPRRPGFVGTLFRPPRP